MKPTYFCRHFGIEHAFDIVESMPIVKKELEPFMVYDIFLNKYFFDENAPQNSYENITCNNIKVIDLRRVKEQIEMVKLIGGIRKTKARILNLISQKGKNELREALHTYRECI